jgi:hypothetical protein
MDIKTTFSVRQFNFKAFIPIFNANANSQELCKHQSIDNKPFKSELSKALWKKKQRLVVATALNSIVVSLLIIIRSIVSDLSLKLPRVN